MTSIGFTWGLVWWEPELMLAGLPAWSWSALGVSTAACALILIEVLRRTK